jgi:hypothetical protein
MNPERRPSRLAATDRTIVGITGALALAAGIGLLGVQQRWWGDRDSADPILARSWDAGWGRNPIRWLIVAAVASLLLVLALVWLVHRIGRARPRTDVEHRFDVPAAPVVDLRRGGAHSIGGSSVPVRVAVPPDTVEQLAEQVIIDDADVRSVRAQLLEAEGGGRSLSLTVELPAGVPVASVQRRLDEHLIPSLRSCLGVPDLRTEVRYTISSEAPARAR